jgi:26S proteasome regulatory subunit N10
VTHTRDLGQIIKATHTASRKIGGSIDIPTAIAIAQLALKHRENKNLRQRIIVFVASPLDGPGTDEKSLVKLAKKLKKNNVAVDIVSFGDGIEEGEKSMLKTFVDNVSSSDNSWVFIRSSRPFLFGTLRIVTWDNVPHYDQTPVAFLTPLFLRHLVSIPPGSHLLSDMLLSSPILSSDRGISDDAMRDGASGSGAVAGGEFDMFNVDPSLDPELAMVRFLSCARFENTLTLTSQALRMSMQEAQAREDAEQALANAAAVAVPSAPLPVSTTPPTSSTAIAAEPTADEEEALLQKALEMSKGDGEDVDMAGGDEDEDMDEEEAIARAIEMSMRGEQEEKK